MNQIDLSRQVQCYLSHAAITLLHKREKAIERDAGDDIEFYVELLVEFYL